jgi:hypothetical protein
MSERPDPPQPDPALKRLDRLVGRWTMAGNLVGSDERNIKGETKFPVGSRRSPSQIYPPGSTATRLRVVAGPFSKNSLPVPTKTGHTIRMTNVQHGDGPPLG